MDLRPYNPALSEEQNRLLLAVESEDFLLTVQLTENLINESAELFGDKHLDYILLLTSLKKKNQEIIKFFLSKNCRFKSPTNEFKFQHSALYYAIHNRDIVIFRELYRKGASIFDDEDDILPTLELAMESFQTFMIDFILDEVICSKRLRNLSPTSSISAAFLLASCWANNSKALNIFISRNFPVNVRSCFGKEEWRGFTPLHFALAASSHDTVNALLQYNVDFCAQDHAGNTPVHMAFRIHEKDHYHDNDVLRRYITRCNTRKLKNPSDKNGLSHFMITCCLKFEEQDRKLQTQCLNLLKSFINNGVNVNESLSVDDQKFPGYTALNLAINYSCIETVKLLVENGSDIFRKTKGGRTPLELMVKSLGIEEEFDLTPVNVFIQYGARLGYDDLKSIEMKGGISAVRAVLNKSWEKDPRDKTVIDSLIQCNLIDFVTQGCACKEDCIPLCKVMDFTDGISLVVVEHLIKYWGLNLNQKFCTGYTALHVAVMKEHTSLISLLVNAGADINIEDWKGNSAFHYVLQGVKEEYARQPEISDESNLSYQPDEYEDMFECYSIDLSDYLTRKFVSFMLKHIKNLLEQNHHVSGAIRSDFRKLLNYFPDKKYRWSHLLRARISSEYTDSDTE